MALILKIFNNMQKIGFIGLGKMGIPMAQNLIKAGYELTVFNRNSAKASDLINAGAKVVSHPVNLLPQCDVIILMVSDDAAVNAIFKGKDGLLSGDIAQKIIINMSTVSPSISKEMEELMAQKNGNYIDAPVSGSLKQAQEGTLVIMAGGNSEAFDRVKPIFDCLGKLALHLGLTGSGNNAKLAINALLSFHAQGLAEAIAFARNKGIKTSDLLELINNSALGNVFMKIKGDAIMQQNYDAVFALKHIAKDLRLAKDEGLNSPLANAAHESFNTAEESLGEEDIISIIKTL
jgi:3-hydroxyisobutyrate dehydrogenase